MCPLCLGGEKKHLPSKTTCSRDEQRRVCESNAHSSRQIKKCNLFILLPLTFIENKEVPIELETFTSKSVS